MRLLALRFGRPEAGFAVTDAEGPLDVRGQGVEALCDRDLASQSARLTRLLAKLGLRFGDRVSGVTTG